MSCRVYLIVFKKIFFLTYKSHLRLLSGLLLLVIGAMAPSLSCFKNVLIFVDSVNDNVQISQDSRDLWSG